MAPDEVPAPSPNRTADLLPELIAHRVGSVRQQHAFAASSARTEAKPADTAGSLLGDALVLLACAAGLALALLVIVPANVWPLWLALGLPVAGARALAGLPALRRRHRIARATPAVSAPALTSLLTDLRVVELGGGEAQS